MQKGIITFLGKGFGFLKTEDGQYDENKGLFFHCTQLQDSHFNDLKVGQTLYFNDIEKSKKGDCAQEIFTNEEAE
jgi:cold shock CspA family protein